MPPVSALLFDKDGTLFHFGETWNIWAMNVIDHLSGGDAAVRAALADAALFDLSNRSFDQASPIIAGTAREATACLHQAIPDRDPDALEALLNQMAAEAPLVPAVPLHPLLSALKGQGYAIGLMTNDSELAAHAHLEAEGITALFDFIAGFDSGFGAKPSPAPLLAFSDATGHAPETCAMVGDSTHDLIAGRAAGMQTVGVLTGPARTETLAPYADVVLPDIGHLQDWLGLPSSKND
ncbi:HAD family hydrolase [Pacificoceanicola onchidii]|uniref:HAD family hydrolase n=1 Tax=Pacificoceanicola onchidii TaxID=2562685 RepID=UPI0010A40114|nr:HAD family hydrolase [Pacificoceanicola onchidii]